jgi:hypothetical protein
MHKIYITNKITTYKVEKDEKEKVLPVQILSGSYSQGSEM